MSTTVTVLVGLSLGTYLLKSAGPVVLGGRPLPGPIDQIARLLPAALLASLVVVNTLADGARLTIDARLAGIVGAAIVLWFRLPFVAVVMVAVAVTAVARAVAG